MVKYVNIQELACFDDLPSQVNGFPSYRIEWDGIAIAVDNQDNSIVTWPGNWENDWSDPDVYAQKIGPEGERLWANDVLVNTDLGNEQRSTAIDIDAEGRAVVAWVDDRNGGEDIYAQRLDSEGSHLWPTDVKVSAGVSVPQQGDPNVVIDTQGRITIVWRHGPEEPPIDQAISEIYAQQLGLNGTILWAEDVRVNRDTTHAFRGHPRARLAPGDSVLVIWEDDRRGYGTREIYAQRLDSEGAWLWAGDLLMSPEDWWGNFRPDLSIESNTVHLTWNLHDDIYAEFFDLDSDLLLLPRPSRVNECDGKADQITADVSLLSDRRALIIWQDYRRSTGDIRAQMVDLDGHAVWPVSFQANDMSESVTQWRPQVATNSHGHALLVWKDDRDGIYGQLIDDSGGRMWVTDLRLNADNRWIVYPYVITMPDNTFVVTWLGQRAANGNLWDVYLQRVDEDGNRFWLNDLRVNTEDYVLNEVDVRSRPAMAVDAQGHLVVAWRGDTGNVVDIYMRRLASDGTADWTDDLALNAHLLNLPGRGGEVSCAVVADDQITVAWAADQDGLYGMYAQRLDLAGLTLWGSGVWINSTATEAFYGNPSLAITQEGDVVILWDDERERRNAFAQCLSPTGALLWSDAVRLNDFNSWPTHPTLSAESDGSLVAVWNDGRYGDENVYARRVDSDGSLPWTSDLALISSESYYYPDGIAESNTLDGALEDIIQASLVVSQTLNGGSVTYYLSNDGGETWEETASGELHTFSSSGSDLRWKAILHASEDRHRSPVIHSLTIRYGPDVVGDAYEPDDTCALAQYIPSNGTVQHHAFHDQSDIDWVSFDAISGTVYLIEAQVPADSSADVMAELHDQCGGIPLASQSHAFTTGIRLEYQAAFDGPAYLKLLNFDPNIYGFDVTYDLSVRALGSEPTPGALVLVAGRLKTPDPLQDNIHGVSNAVYNLFLAHGYTDDRIYYLATDLAMDGVDALSSTANLQAAITTWASLLVDSDRPFTLYLVDHGKYDRFYLDKLYAEWASPQQIDNWVTYLETANPGVKVNIIIEACQSGSFIDLAETVSRSGRVVIASTGARNLAYASDGGAIFSDHFLTALGQEASLFNSFETARWAVAQAHTDQIPWLDDDGDGIANDPEDGQEAAQRGFAYAGTLGDDAWPPYIFQVVVSVDEEQGIGEIRAEVRDDEAVRWVWAVVYPPSYVPPVPGEELEQETLPTLMLLERGDDWYAANYTGFDEIGAYRVVVYSEDDNGMAARPRAVVVRTGWPIYLPLALSTVE